MNSKEKIEKMKECKTQIEKAIGLILQAENSLMDIWQALVDEAPATRLLLRTAANTTMQNIFDHSIFGAVKGKSLTPYLDILYIALQRASMGKTCAPEDETFRVLSEIQDAIKFYRSLGTIE